MGRPSSTVEIPDKRHRIENGGHSPDSDSPRDHRRRRSPDYGRYDPDSERRHRRRSDSPDYPNSRRSPRSDARRVGSGDRKNRSATFLDRDYKNGRYSESESDEELKGLSFEEYRRLKRQKLRRMLRNCIWNVTPSPPRNANEEEFEPEPEEFTEKYVEEEDKRENNDLKKEINGSAKSELERSERSESESESESDSESEDSRSRRKRKGSRSRRRTGKSSYSDSESDGDDSESDDYEDSRSRKKGKSSSSRRRNKKSSYSDSDSEDDASENDDFSGPTPSWTLSFVGFCDSYSFPSSSSQARLRVHENVKRYARNYATLFIICFACSLYQMPIALVGLISSLALWDLLRFCSDKWRVDRYPVVRQALIHTVQCATAVVLFCSNVQFALFCALGVSYAVMILHASFRKLTPAKQPTPAR